MRWESSTVHFTCSWFLWLSSETLTYEPRLERASLCRCHHWRCRGGSRCAGGEYWSLVGASTTHCVVSLPVLVLAEGSTVSSRVASTTRFVSFASAVPATLNKSEYVFWRYQIIICNSTGVVVDSINSGMDVQEDLKQTCTFFLHIPVIL